MAIEKLIRLTALKFKDIIATPCFTVHNAKEENEKVMLCASSATEKETWIQALIVQSPHSYESSNK